MAIQLPIRAALYTRSRGLLRMLSPELGVELVINGGFDTDATGWTAWLPENVSLTVVSGQLVLTSLTSTTGSKQAFQQVAVVPGGTYTFAYNFVSETTVGQVRLGNSLNGQEYALVTAPEQSSLSFVPTASEIFITLLLASTQASGSTAVYDDISIVRTA